MDIIRIYQKGSGFYFPLWGTTQNLAWKWKFAETDEVRWKKFVALKEHEAAQARKQKTAAPFFLSFFVSSFERYCALCSIL